MKVWIDGAVRDARDACVPVTDHGLLYGDGVFEGIRAHGDRVFRLDRHLERLHCSAACIGLELPKSPCELRDIIHQTVSALGRPETYLRLIVTRGDGAMGVDPLTCPEPRLICIACEAEIYPRAVVERGLDLVTTSVRRPAFDVLDPRAKTLNYLNSALARREAGLRGADDGLILNAAGRIAEASVANVFALRRGELLTPPAWEGALEGVTREAVLELAGGLGLAVEERPLSRADLLSASEVFLTGTGVGLVAVRSLDGQAIAAGTPGSTTAKLREAYGELTRAN